MKNDEYKINKKNNTDIKPKFSDILKNELRAFLLKNHLIK